MEREKSNTENIPEPVVVEKRPLAKSFSQPSYAMDPNATFTRRRSSSVVTERPIFRAVPPAKAVPVSDKLEEASLCPNFVFLQLFYSSFGNSFENIPILLETNEVRFVWMLFVIKRTFVSHVTCIAINHLNLNIVAYENVGVKRVFLSINIPFMLPHLQ